MTDRARAAAVLGLLLLARAALHGPAAQASTSEAPSASATSAPRGGGQGLPGAATEASPGAWRVSAVPRLSFTNDEGVGLGVRGTAFWYRHGAQPYKTAVSFQVFATGNGVQQHFVRVDALDAVGLPLRLLGEVGYSQSLNFHFCLRGGVDLCDLAAPTAAGAWMHALPGPTRAGAVDDRRFLHRFLQPYAQTAARWRLGTRPHQPELAASWRGALYIPGALTDEDGDGQLDLTPYPGSLYAQRFPEGERGLVSVLQLGATLDDRDHEPDPVRGYFLQAAVRASHPLWGSAWSFAGAHLGLRLFSPLTRGAGLSLASHLFVDAIAGDAPTAELARIGGFAETFAYGGPDVGRGIRQQRFLGAGKAAGQWELRAHVGEAQIAGEHLRLRVAAFLDAGLSVERLEDPLHVAPRLVLGWGVGLRVVWNRNFVMRIDVAVSQAEGNKPFLYTRPDHPF